MTDQSVETMDESTIRRLTVFLFIYMLGIVISNAALIGLLVLRKNLRKISHLYIVALFFSELDGLILTSSMLLDLNGGLDTTKCVGIRYAEEIALTFGIFALIGIAVDSYRCIVYPQLYKPTFLSTIFVIAGLLIASFIFSLNVFIENIYIKMCNILIEDEDSDLWWQVYGFIVHFVLPLVVLIVLYFRIVKKLWMKEEVLSASTVMKRRTVKLTLICSAAYVMCWLPFNIFEIVHDSIAWSDGHEELFVNSRFVTIFIALSGSLINPIIYGCFSQNVVQEIWLIKNELQCKPNQIDVMNNSEIVS